MARFPYHRLPSEYAFQDLVSDVCRFLLGEGLEKFAKGKDGGRDGRFKGTANCFPSTTEPLSGGFVVQAKWCQDEAATFADSAFQRQLATEEAPKAAKLVKSGELDHWLIFSNRRRNAVSATALEKKLKEDVGCASVHLRGAEELDAWLGGMPDLVKRYDLEGLLFPFQLDPLEIRSVIETLHAQRAEALARATARWDFEGYKGIAKKNEINGMTDRYFKSAIRDYSEPHFASIKAFLENPRNWELAEEYHEAASEIQAKAMAFRDRLGAFDFVVEHVCDELCRAIPGYEGSRKRRVVRVLLHYMYATCDFGEKSE